MMEAVIIVITIIVSAFGMFIAGYTVGSSKNRIRSHDVKNARYYR